MKNTRKILQLLLLVASATIILYGFREFNRRNRDLGTVDPEFSVRDTALIGSFIRTNATGTRLIGRVGEVDGINRVIEKNDRGRTTVVLGLPPELSSVRCSLDSSYGLGIATWQPGNFVRLKGLLVGFNIDETGLLGSDVELSRCVPIRCSFFNADK